MGLHDDIKAACSEAAPAIARAAEGTEAAIYHLPLRVADLMAVLVNDGRVIDALERKGITITIRQREPAKHA